MTETLMKLSLLPNPIRLHELVALEEGFFMAEGVEPEVHWQEFHELMGAWAEFTGPGAKGTGPGAMRAAQRHSGDEVASACQWGTVNISSSEGGRWFRDAYAVSRQAIFVRPDSSIERPEDLADVEIAVGWRAGSHYNTFLRLEQVIPLEQIKPIPVGGYGRRLEALLEGEVEAASLLDPQIQMADELGLRKVVSGDFDCLFWVDEEIESEALRRFFRALQRAEEAMQADLTKYLPLWEQCIPPEFKDRDWNLDQWVQGTRFVMAPYSDEKYDETLAQIERWGLDDHMQAKDLVSTTRSCF